MDVKTSENREEASVAGGQADRKIGEMLLNWSQQTSRRGFLTRIGSMVIAAVGGTAIGALPADRRVALAFVNQNCNDWRWCALTGRPCAACGGTNTTCPGTGCTFNQFWSSCCTQPGGCGKIIRYYDCCGSCNQTCGIPGSTQCNKAGGLSGPWCNGYTDALYKCTLASLSGANCPCAPPP